MPPPPSTDDVRLAVLHLIHLAAAYEGKGLDAREKPSGDARRRSWATKREPEDQDSSCLAQVVHLLLANRQSLRRRQRDEMFARFVKGLAGIYTERIGLGDIELDADVAKIRGVFQGVGMELSSDDAADLELNHHRLKGGGFVCPTEVG